MQAELIESLDEEEQQLADRIDLSVPWSFTRTKNEPLSPSEKHIIAWVLRPRAEQPGAWAGSDHAYSSVSLFQTVSKAPETGKRLILLVLQPSASLFRDFWEMHKGN